MAHSLMPGEGVTKTTGSSLAELASFLVSCAGTLLHLRPRVHEG